MRERPILFSSPMVRAILAGTKTQTRRAVKSTGMYAIDASIHGEEVARRELAALATRCPYGQPGDRLWVRETWQGPLIDEELEEEFHQSPGYFKKPEFCAYRATDTLDAINADGEELGWRPSIHMPRWASRILLEVTSVRVERLQDISEADAEAEGIQEIVDAGVDHDGTPRDAYRALWEEIHGGGSWEKNPWVWVVEFKRAEVPA